MVVEYGLHPVRVGRKGYTRSGAGQLHDGTILPERRPRRTQPPVWLQLDVCITRTFQTRVSSSNIPVATTCASLAARDGSISSELWQPAKAANLAKEPQPTTETQPEVVKVHDASPSALRLRRRSTGGERQLLHRPSRCVPVPPQASARCAELTEVIACKVCREFVYSIT